MKHRFRRHQGWLAGAAILTLAACSAEGPTQGPLGPAALITTPGLTVGVSVCKVSTDAETEGVVFTFNTTDNSPVVAGAPVTVVPQVESEARPLGVPGDCKLVWVRSNASFDDESEITVDEVLPAGYHLDQISFTGTGHANEVVPDAIIDPASTSVTFKAYAGMTVLFKNSFVFTPPPPPPPPPPPGDEGCTPGYWKVEQHHDSWVPTGYATTDLITSVFTGVNAPQGGTNTLLDALNFGGGSGVDGAEKILLRAAVAGLLNTAHPDVAYAGGGDVTAFITAVNAALGSDDRDAMLALAASIDADNNAGCSLN